MGENKCTEHRLKAAVLKHMLHKCSVGFCLPKDGPRICSKNFPKGLCDETTRDDGGYPIYRRSPGDEYVVPYSPSLLLKFDCHINVELCTSTWVIKYMHKYMHKGPDYIKVMTKDLYRNLQAGGFDMTDDLEMFQVFRYLSAGEAMCRIFGYDLSRSSVGCTRLTVHLEGMDWVGEVGSNSSQSQLLQYFSRPEELEPLLYLQYFSSYSLQKASAAVKSAADEAGGGLVSPPSGNDYYVDNCNPPNKVTKRNVGSLHVARMYPVQSTHFAALQGCCHYSAGDGRGGAQRGMVGRV